MEKKAIKNRTWDTSYMLNIPIIDQQHEILFDIHDEIQELKKQGGNYNNGTMKSILQKLEDFLNTHFKTEEELMEKAHFPDLLHHKQEHKLFTNKISNFVFEYQYNNPFLLDNMLLFLKKWLVSHIMASDTEYKDYVLPILEKETQQN